MQVVFLERNKDASKALNASFKNKMQAFAVSFFKERNEDAIKALNTSLFDHKMQALCSLFLCKGMKMRAKHLMSHLKIRCRHLKLVCIGKK